jgi:hypothetical protein
MFPIIYNLQVIERKKKKKRLPNMKRRKDNHPKFTNNEEIPTS